MYKTKLQELCHQNNWGLPSYTSMKEGPDHNPRFKSSVFVNGLSFNSSVSCNSSKHSQNDAAQLALLHFTSSPPPTGSSTSKPVAGGLGINEVTQRLDVLLDTCSGKSNTQRRYKSQLQNYAQKKNLDSPLYFGRREGLVHVPFFKATVTVDGITFESPKFFTNLKEAEHAAAKVALISLSSDGFQEDDLGFYKNLLQELSQGEGLCIPVYKTVKSGAPHMPTFVSSVELEGEIFYGNAGTSKKEAEMKAAKVAYTSLVERRQSRSTGFTSLVSEVDGTTRSTLIPDLDVSVDSLDLMQKYQPTSSLTTNYIEEATKEEAQDMNLSETFSSNMEDTEDSIRSPVVQSMHKMIGNLDKLVSTCSITNADVSDVSVSDSGVGRNTGAQSYLLCNRVRIYSSIPDTEFPKGITMLPISDNRWVAVSLEFPNELGN